MQNLKYINYSNTKKIKSFTKRHYEIIDDLEKMLEKGVPELTMSQIASNLKISLRTLYEIAPSKNQLIIMIMDSILRKLGRHALDSISNIKSPLKRLEKYLYLVNQAVGPKFNTFFRDIEKIEGLEEVADYHANFITNMTEELLNQAIQIKEIQNIDSKAFSILLGGIGREFIKEKNKLIDSSPEESANSITSIILNGIKLRN
ncbi:MAG: TetR family transcriptional regulator [Gammaproteobacteria bacterium]|nr:TetR family transcriptional regulator [Gammaproteobacteria bacterium]|tara:strand:- start:642 stop:1250 length:609 start_codon:yes stop_codon:yes gene_type:complete